MPDPVLLDLAPADVHKASTGQVELISADKRNALPGTAFAIPSKRAYPLDTAARVRNAAARLEQMHKRGKVSDADYKTAKGHIAAAAKKFGIDSKFNASDKADRRKRVGHSIHVRADLAPGGALHVRHMNTFVSADGRWSLVKDGESVLLRDVRAITTAGDEIDPASVGVKLIGPDKWKDGTPVKLVWVQLAEVGAWKGHSTGPFKMDAKDFGDIVHNFNERGIPLQFDFDHVSELPTDKVDPKVGAPAQGWIYKLDNRGQAGLWGLVGWLDDARDGIKAGKYAFLSPALRFATKDPVTGNPSGARLTSAAITNSPFLTGIGTLRAASEKASWGIAGTEVHGTLLRTTSGPDALVHQPHEYLPAIKSALKLHELSTHTEMSDKLDALRDCCLTAGPHGVHQGVNLTEYTTPLRDLVGAAPGMTVEELFDKVQDLIDEAIEEHVEQYHEGESASMNDKTTTGSAPDTTPGNAGKDTTMPLTDAEITALQTEKTTLLTAKTSLETEKVTLSTKVTSLEGEVSTLTLKLKGETSRADEAVAAVKEIAALLTMAAGETVTGAVKRMSEEATKLLKDKTDRDEADLLADVDVAFAVYKDQRKLCDADKAHMLASARSNREAFNGMFPPVSVEQRMLLRTVVQDEKRPDALADPATQSLEGLTKALILKGMSYTEASTEAARQLNAKNKR
jgi:phage I-like protein